MAADELKALAGEWTLVAGEKGGEPIAAAELTPMRLSVSEDGTALIHIGEGKLTTRVTLDPTSMPKRIVIDLLSAPLAGKRQYGIYKVEGARWTVFTADIGHAESDRPRDFDTGANPGRLVVWERATIAAQP